MPLQIPTRDAQRDRIVLRMLARQGGAEVPRDVRLTDLTTISVLRILLEEVFIEEFQALYAGVFRQQRNWFIDTAEGADLERRLADYGLTREAARAATGFLRVSNLSSQAFSVSPGTVYRTEADAAGNVKRYSVLPNPDTASGVYNSDAGYQALVKVQALESGTAGNTAANTIVELESTDPLQESITNEAPLVDGRGAESDPELRDRFKVFLASLTRGTRAALVAGILSYTDAAGAQPVRSVGLVEWGGQTLLSGSSSAIALRVYIEDGTGFAGAGLVAAIQSLVDGDDSEGSGLRAAGIPTEVVSSSPHPINVDVSITVEAGASTTTVQTAVESAIRAHIGRLPIASQSILGTLSGQLTHARLSRDIVDVPSVLSVRFREPTSDRPIPIGRKAIPGDVAVTVTSE